MANHYGNFNIFGRLSVSQNVSGGYEFPEEIGESNQALGVKNGQLEFIDVEGIQEVDGGSANTVYLVQQTLDGGSA